MQFSHSVPNYSFHLFFFLFFTLCIVLTDPSTHRRLDDDDIRRATEDDYVMVHSSEHVSTLASSTEHERPSLPRITSDTYICQHSWPAVTAATGCVLSLMHEMMEETDDEKRLCNGYALIRPPGHHAVSDHAMGFCLVNHVAVAAAVASQQHGSQRVAIVDWDVHHCNGTQEMFEDNPDVLVISVHRHDNGWFYPGTGGAHEVGVDDGEGFNVNIPLLPSCAKFMDDEEGYCDLDYIEVCS